MNRVAGRGRKNTEKQDRKCCPDFLKRTSRKTDVKDSANKGSEGSEERGRENVYHLRRCLDHWEQTDTDDAVVRALRDVSDKLLETGGEQIITIMCPAAMWKAELVNDEPGC